MNQNLPKAMLEALARQTPPDGHPPPDLLNAFAENALSGTEYRRIVDHLARCGDCREIVFLADSAIDRLAPVEEQLVAPRLERRWVPRLVWGVSIAAGVLIVAGALMFFRRESVPSRVEMALKATGVPATQPASTQPMQPATTPETTTEVSAAPAVAKPSAKTGRAKAVRPAGAETLGTGASAGIVANAIPRPAKAPTTATATAPAVSNPESATITIGNAAPPMTQAPPPAPHVNSFAAVQGGPLAGAVPGSADQILLNPQTAARAPRATHPQWRITPDGHLEHLAASGWTRLLANQTATFRVVSVVGDHVWVGGNGGALFHSRDDGQSWEEVALSGLNGRETSIIVAIQFDDPQHGTVTTENGARCTTTDGGTNWNCQ